MKARVKATGEIVEVFFRGGIWINKEVPTKVYLPEEIENVTLDVKEKIFPKDAPDYWTRLEHQYAGMAMQGLMSNIEQITRKKGRSFCDEIVDISFVVAHALVEKYKKEEK